MENSPQVPLRVRSQHFYFQRIDNTSALEDSYALRYQVYCLEKGFLPEEDYPSGLEFDEFDDNSLHFGAFNLQGDIVGTVRLVMSSSMGFPLVDHCQIDEDELPCTLNNSSVINESAHIAEVSRLAVSKLYRRRSGDGLYCLTGVEDEFIDNGVSRRRRPEIVLGLYKILYQESKRQGIKSWFAAMEQSLSRLLGHFSFNFIQIGPKVDYYGPVSPFFVEINDIEKGVYSNRPDLFWEFVEGLEAELLPEVARKRS